MGRLECGGEEAGFFHGHTAAKATTQSYHFNRTLLKARIKRRWGRC